MAIHMVYECGCGYSSHILNDAQAHANTTGHPVRIVGSLTANVQFFDTVAIEKAAEQRARDSAVMRAAKERGLLRGDKDGVR